MNCKQSQIYFDCFDHSDDLFLSSEQSSQIQVKQPLIEFYEFFETFKFIFFVNC